MDLISRQAAIDVIEPTLKSILQGNSFKAINVMDKIRGLPSAEPETSRIEQELHGKTPEEQYDFIYWLLLKFGLGYTDSRLAILEWLRGDDGDVHD